MARGQLYSSHTVIMATMKPGSVLIFFIVKKTAMVTIDGVSFKVLVLTIMARRG